MRQCRCIGAVICRYDTGERFQVAAITDTGLSVLTEDGVEDHIPSHSVNGGVEHNEDQINSFQQHRKLGQSLLAAEQAAQRRLNPDHSNSLVAEEASRVSQIVQEQRQAFHDRLCIECNSRKKEHLRSFDDVLKSAKDRSANQHQEQGVQPNNLTR